MTSEQEKSYNKLVTKYTNNYKYIFTKEELEIIILEQFNSTYQLNSKMNNKEIFIQVDNLVKKYLNEYISNKLVEDAYLIVNNFINIKMKDNLKELTKFFNDFKYVPDIDFLEKLIQNNEILKITLGKFVTKNLNRIKFGYIDEISLDMNLINMIDIYCLLNNIEIKEIDLNDETEEVSNNEIVENKENIIENNIDEDLEGLDKDLKEYEKQLIKDECNYPVEDGVNWYLNLIGSYPLLTKEEEINYGYELKMGNLEARKKLVEHNLRLVIPIAKRKKGRGIPFQDLIQAGNLGLIEAVERFDIDKGYCFSTYANCWIKHSILKEIAEHSRTISLPPAQYYSVNKYNKVKDQLLVTNNKEPSKEELMAILNISKSRLDNILNTPEDTISFNVKSLDEDDSSELIDLIADEYKDFSKDIFKDELAIVIRKMIEHDLFTDEEKLVLTLHFGLNGSEGLTYKQIANVMNINRYQRVHQIISNAFRKIRTSKYGEILAQFYDNPDEAKEIIEVYRNAYEKARKSKNYQPLTKKQFEESYEEYQKQKKK